jgi:hypothetical protein
VVSHLPLPHSTVQLPLVLPTTPTTPNGPLLVDGPELFQSEPQSSARRHRRGPRKAARGVSRSSGSAVANSAKQRRALPHRRAADAQERGFKLDETQRVLAALSRPMCDAGGREDETADP